MWKTAESTEGETDTAGLRGVARPVVTVERVCEIILLRSVTKLFFFFHLIAKAELLFQKKNEFLFSL